MRRIRRRHRRTRRPPPLPPRPARPPWVNRNLTTHVDTHSQRPRGTEEQYKRIVQASELSGDGPPLPSIARPADEIARPADDIVMAGFLPSPTRHIPRTHADEPVHASHAELREAMGRTSHGRRDPLQRVGDAVRSVGRWIGGHLDLMAHPPRP